MSHHPHPTHDEHHQPTERPPNPILEKLRAIAKPKVWGPIGAISLVGVFVWQVSEHPDWYQVEAEPEVSADGLTPEERAIAAEIDSSGLLAEELHLGKPEGFNFFNAPIQGGEDLPIPEIEGDRTSQSPPPSEPDLPALPELFPQQPPSQKTGANPFQAGTAGRPSQTATGVGLNPLGTGIFGTSAQTGTDGQAPLGNPSLPASPLQVAMDQYLFPSATEETAPTPETATRSIDATGTLNSGTTTADLPNTDIPLPASAEPIPIPQPTWVVPRTVMPIDGTAATVQTPVSNPYQTNTALPQPLPQAQQANIRPAPVLPPNPANPYGQYNYGGSHPYAGSPNSGNFGTSGNPNYQTTTPNLQNYVVGPSNLNQLDQNRVVRQQTPFSAPRRIPGRAIGGGEINSFSNP